MGYCISSFKSRAQGTWEAHRKYIDVQFFAAGVQEMGRANLKTLTMKKSYEERDDYSLFEDAALGEVLEEAIVKSHRGRSGQKRGRIAMNMPIVSAAATGRVISQATTTVLAREKSTLKPRELVSFVIFSPTVFITR